VKDVSDEMIEWKTQGTKLYQQLPADCKSSLKECEPLRELERERPKQQDIYKTWKNSSKNQETIKQNQEIRSRNQDPPTND
jgi:phenylacetic acid degradation protein